MEPWQMIVTNLPPLGEDDDLETPEVEFKHSDTLGEVLSHYGVKGMKWGVKNATASVSAKAKKLREVTPGSEDHERAQALRKKKPKDLSNDELKALTTRLQLEKQYKDLQISPKSDGRKFLEQEGKRVARDLIKEHSGTIITQLVKLATKT